jgi:hypothetical protein
MYVIPNSIEVDHNGIKHFFASLLHRDATYELSYRLWLRHLDPEARQWEISHSAEVNALAAAGNAVRRDVAQGGRPASALLATSSSDGSDVGLRSWSQSIPSEATTTEAASVASMAGSAAEVPRPTRDGQISPARSSARRSRTKKGGLLCTGPVPCKCQGVHASMSKVLDNVYLLSVEALWGLLFGGQGGACDASGRTFMWNFLEDKRKATGKVMDDFLARFSPPKPTNQPNSYVQNCL